MQGHQRHQATLLAEFPGLDRTRTTLLGPDQLFHRIDYTLFRHPSASGRFPGTMTTERVASMVTVEEISTVSTDAIVPFWWE